MLIFALMRAYKFLCEKYGLESIEKRRLKQSRVSDLNDPFELRSFNLTNVVIRKTFEQTAEDVDKVSGMLCFSADWINPVMWAHYSDKHKGLCLGFDIPDLNEDPKNDAGYVRYVPQVFPFPSPAEFDKMPDDEHVDFARSALFTKVDHWTYEKEIRSWGVLANEDHGLYFVPFGDQLRLAAGSSFNLLSLARTSSASINSPRRAAA